MQKDRSVVYFNFIFVVILTYISIQNFLARWAGLNPVSLWLDDQWVAALMRLPSVWDLFSLPAASPVGFLLITKLNSTLFADKEWPLQILPVICGSLFIPLLALFVRSLTASNLTALFIAILASLSTQIASTTVMVKHYSVELFCILSLMYLTLPIFKNKINYVPRSLFYASLFTLFMGFTGILGAFPLINLPIILNVLKRKNWKECFKIKHAHRILIFNICIIPAYYGLYRHRGNMMMKEIWREHFIPLHDFKSLITFSLSFSKDYSLGMLDSTFYSLALFIFIGALYSLWKPEFRRAGIFLILFFTEFAILSAAKKYPFAGGRTDVFSFAPAFVLLALGIYPVLHRFEKNTKLHFLALICALSTAIYMPPARSAYSGDQDNKLIEWIETELNVSDPVVISPHSQWVATYYSSHPSRFEKSWSMGHNFESFLQRENTLVLPTSVGSKMYSRTPSILFPMIEKFTENKQQFYFLVTRGSYEQFPSTKKYLKSMGWKQSEAFRTDAFAVLYRFYR